MSRSLKRSSAYQGVGVISELIKRSVLCDKLLEQPDNPSSFVSSVVLVCGMIRTGIESGGKILIFGNGGSATDAQHFAAELVCKFEKVRKPIAAIALTADSAILTAQANDVGFESVFSRQIEALARPGDLVIGFTTSDPNFGNTQSRNIINAFNAAKGIHGLKIIGFFGARTKHLLPKVDAAVIAPSENTALVQGAHRIAIHVICGMIEDDF